MILPVAKVNPLAKADAFPKLRLCLKSFTSSSLEAISVKINQELSVEPSSIKIISAFNPNRLMVSFIFLYSGRRFSASFRSGITIDKSSGFFKPSSSGYCILMLFKCDFKKDSLFSFIFFSPIIFVRY